MPRATDSIDPEQTTVHEAAGASEQPDRSGRSDPARDGTAA